MLANRPDLKVPEARIPDKNNRANEKAPAPIASRRRPGLWLRFV